MTEHTIDVHHNGRTPYERLDYVRIHIANMSVNALYKFHFALTGTYVTVEQIATESGTFVLKKYGNDCHDRGAATPVTIHTTSVDSAAFFVIGALHT